MFAPNPNNPPQAFEDGPLKIPSSYLRVIKEHEVLEKSILDYADLIKRDSSRHPDNAGEETEKLFHDLIRKLVPDEFTIVRRGRIAMDDGEHSPQLDLLILKPGANRKAHSFGYYPRSSVLAAFECKTTLRKSDYDKIARTANSIKGNYADGNALRDSSEDVMPTCTPYFGILALTCEQGLKEPLGHTLVDQFIEKLKYNTICRQVDVILIPGISLFSITHCIDPFDKKTIDFCVTYEPSIPLYEGTDGNFYLWKIDGSKPAGYHKRPQHNSILGFAFHLCSIISEFSPSYKHMLEGHGYYGNGLVTACTPHVGYQPDADE